MKKLLFFGAVMFSLIQILPADAVIKFKDTVVDFGTAESGKLVEVRFEFENAGNTPLRIISIQPSCGCTTTKLEKTEYAPGEKGTIPVIFNTRAYVQRVAKTIVVRTNDPMLASVNLTLTGIVRNERSAAPAVSAKNLNFGRVQRLKTRKMRFTIHNPRSMETKIVEVQHLPDIQIEFPSKGKRIPARGSLDVDVVLMPLETGRLDNVVKFRTDDIENPYITIKVEADVK